MPVKPLPQFTDPLLKQFQEEHRAAGASEAEITALWDQLKRRPGTTVDIVPNPELDSIYADKPNTPELNSIYTEAPVPTPELDDLYKAAPAVPAPPAPAPMVAPSGAVYPDKSTLDKAIGTFGRGIYEYTKGLTGPVWQGAKFFGHDIPDWHIAMAQHHLNPDVEMPGLHPLEKAFQGIVKTAQENPTDLLGRSAEGVREEGPGWLIQSPGNVGTAVGDTLSNLLMLGPVARGAAAASRAALPAKVAAAVDRGVGFIIPKYNFPDAALAEEAAREGRYLAGSARTEELTRSAKELMTREPGAAPLLEPKIAAGPAAMKRFQKEYAAHETLGPATTGWIPFDYKTRKLELSVDNQGRISYLREPEFNALAPADQARIGEIRNAIEANSQALNKEGIVSDAKMLPGYLAKKYSAFEQPRVWGKKLETQGGQMAIAEAKDYISRKTGIVNDAILNETIKEILSPDFKEVWQTQGPMTKNMGDWSHFAQNLAKRKALPPEIEKIMGPMASAEHMPYRVGYTLDAQLKMLTNHQTLDNLAGMTSNTGKPLIYTGPLKPPGYITIPKDEIFGKWQGAHVNKDIADILPTLQGNTTNSFLSKYMSAWKASKTSWSPSTHLNNLMGDVIFAHLAGVNPLNPMNTKYYKQAAEELHTYLKDTSKIPSSMVREALDAGGIRPGFAGNELTQLTNKIRRLAPEQTAAEAALGVLTDNRVAQKLRDLYDAEDQVFRYAGYLKHRDLGLTPMQASAEVNKYFPSYATSSPAGRYLRGQGHWSGNLVGSPFTSFPMEAARIYATAAREAPWRLSAVGALPLSLTALNLGNSGYSIQDWHRTMDRLPSGIKGRTLIPMVGPDGQIEVSDWSNIIPLANWNQSGESMAESGPARDLLFGGPAVNALKIAFNTDLAGHKMYDSSKGQGWPEMLSMIAQQIAPLPQGLLNLLPTGQSRLEKSLADVPPRHYAPDVETPGQAAFRSVFPNLSAKSIDELEHQGNINRKAGIRETQQGKRSIQRNMSIPPETKERLIPNILDELYGRRSR